MCELGDLNVDGEVVSRRLSDQNPLLPVTPKKPTQHTSKEPEESPIDEQEGDAYCDVSDKMLNTLKPNHLLYKL